MYSYTLCSSSQKAKKLVNSKRLWMVLFSGMVSNYVAHVDGKISARKEHCGPVGSSVIGLLIAGNSVS